MPFAVLNGYEPDAAPEVVYDVSIPVDRAAEAKADQEEAKALQEDVRAWRLMRDNGYEAGPLDSYLRSKGHKVPAGRVASMGDDAPKAGDRIKVREPHMGMKAGDMGTVQEVSPEHPLAIQMDGEEMVHKWYVPSEVERI